MRNRLLDRIFCHRGPVGCVRLGGALSLAAGPGQARLEYSGAGTRTAHSMPTGDPPHQPHLLQRGDHAHAGRDLSAGTAPCSFGARDHVRCSRGLRQDPGRDRCRRRWGRGSRPAGDLLRVRDRLPGQGDHGPQHRSGRGPGHGETQDARRGPEFACDDKVEETIRSAAPSPPLFLGRLRHPWDRRAPASPSRNT